MAFLNQNEKIMKLAINLALKGLGRTQTNPLVGCLIVNNGKIVGKGFHEKFGENHAEINALKIAGNKAKGSTLYVSLEPCFHSGKEKKTPPCVPAIVNSGIRKVVIGMKDLNPKVKGKGIQALKKAGIQVQTNILEKECIEINQAYLKWIQTRIPYIVQKIGMTANGLIWSKEQKEHWINGKKTQRFVHQLRNTLDGILVGVKTVIQDNPRLTCRIKNGRNPVRIILDPFLEIPVTAKVLNQKGKIIIVTGNKLDSINKIKKRKLEKRLKEKIQFLELPIQSGKFNLKQVFKKLGKQNIGSILVEGGQTLNTSLLKAKIADQIMIVVSPKVFQTGTYFIQPKIAGKFNLKITEMQKSGNDILITCKN